MSSVKSSGAELSEGTLSQVNRRAKPSQVMPSQVQVPYAKSRWAELSKAVLDKSTDTLGRVKVL